MFLELESECRRLGGEARRRIYALGMFHNANGSGRLANGKRHPALHACTHTAQEPAGVPVPGHAGHRWISISGAIAAMVPAGPGVALAIAGRPGALPLFIMAAVVAVVTGILSAAVALYQARQETVRTQVRHHSNEMIAQALAGCITATHTRAQDLTDPVEIQEADRVRASARQLLAGWHPQQPQ
jgi:hypothetical protein